MNRKEKISGLYFVRMVLAIGIIAFHFYVHSASNIKLFYDFNNYSFGDIINRVFFVISGALLFYNYDHIDNVFHFYLKRFKHIFPAFWIAYFLEFMRISVSSGTLFWGGEERWKILASLCGLDGYLAGFGLGNYYLLGEWFLGALILLYLLYPILLWAINKSFPATTAIIGIVFVLCVTFQDRFQGMPEKNFVFCMTCFYMGMVIVKYKEVFLESNASFVVSFILCVCVALVPPKVNRTPLYLIFGVALFIVLRKIGEYVEKWKVTASISKFIGESSYEVFLVQHRIISYALLMSNPTRTSQGVMLLACIIVICIIYARLLHSAVLGLTMKRKRA